MKFRLLLVLTAICSVIGTHAIGQVDRQQQASARPMTWLSDLGKAQELAAREKKALLAVFR
ncbi:MAG: hypothetical protein ACI97A_001161 [Planctomycetota bacterium]|jgi:hypothetical protein